MTIFPTTSMVLAAGLGTRMRIFDDTVPKPLVKVAGKCLIDWSLDTLSQSGVKNAVVNTHYMADQLEQHIAARTTPHIALSHETQRLETGGGIANALPLLGGQPFFSMNSDVICLDGAMPFLHRLANAWDADVMDALLLITPIQKASGYKGVGDFFLNENGSIKRREQADAAPYIFTGAQLLHPRLFHNVPEDAFSMNLLYNRDKEPNGTLPRIYGLVHDGAWLHVGDPDGHAAAEQILKEKFSVTS